MLPEINANGMMVSQSLLYLLLGTAVHNVEPGLNPRNWLMSPKLIPGRPEGFSRLCGLPVIFDATMPSGELRIQSDSGSIVAVMVNLCTHMEELADAS